MKKFLIFLLIVVIFIVGGWWLSQSLKFEKETKTKPLMAENIQINKKIAMVIAFKDFRDEEYFRPKEILEGAGIEVKTASDQKGKAIGADGGEVTVDLLVSEVNPAEFDGVVFVGGPGCLKHLDNEDSYRLAKQTLSEGKILAAICISPVILAKAGVLEGKKATVWSSPLEKKPIEVLKENGAIYQEESVVTDENIITANGPAAAQEFGQTILKLLK